MLNTGHFQVSTSSPLSSASAMADRADIGAVGNGSCSRSDINRNSRYPEVNQEMRPTMVPMMSRPIGHNQSGWRKVRSARATESGGGAHHVGNSLDMPNCSASAERTKYWRHRRSRNAPSSRATRALATYTRRKISCLFSDVEGALGDLEEEDDGDPLCGIPYSPARNQAEIHLPGGHDQGNEEDPDDRPDREAVLELVRRLEKRAVLLYLLPLILLEFAPEVHEAAMGDPSMDSAFSRW